MKACFTNPFFEILPSSAKQLGLHSFEEYAKTQMKLIEEAGRTCYLSQNRIGEETHKAFIRGLVKAGHDSVLEHEKLTVRICCSRACSHQLVRHRIGSYSQESQRFVDYSKKDEILFIDDHYTQDLQDWFELCANKYFALKGEGKKSEDARAILPNACATRVCVTYNFRQWRAFFLQRCTKHAQREIRSIALGLLYFMNTYYAPMFEDLADRFLGLREEYTQHTMHLMFETPIIEAQ